MEILSIAFFTFYLLIFANYSGDLLACRIRRHLSDSLLLKHGLGFMMMVFFAVFTSDQTLNLPVLQVLGISVLLYAWFVVTTRMHTESLVVVLLVLLAAYILSVSIKRDTDEVTIRRKRLAIRILNYVALGITVLGTILYLIEKRYEYGSDFSFTQFFVGVLKCRNKSPDLIKSIRSGRGKT